MADRLVHQPGVDRVIGIDVVPPASPLAAEFVRADIRNPSITKTWTVPGSTLWFIWVSSRLPGRRATVRL